MYQEFFTLKEPPFTITPDPHFLFLGRYHQEALAHLLHSVRGSSGFILLTGEVGAGKTTISRCLIQQLSKDVDVALIFNPKLSALELVASICDDLGVYYPETASLKTLFDILNRHLLNSYIHNRTTVLMLDEAQNLSVELLEQVRLLSNLETDRKKLLQIILIGQPELLDTLARPELRQFSQRITTRYHIPPLRLAETREFVRHRLAVAGCTQPIFGFGVLWLIHHTAKGIPRLINQICDRALLGAYTSNKRRVTLGITYAAIREVTGTPRRRRSRLPHAILILFGLMVFIPLSQDTPPSWNSYQDATRASLSFVQSSLAHLSEQGNWLLKWLQPEPAGHAPQDGEEAVTLFKTSPTEKNTHPVTQMPPAITPSLPVTPNIAPGEAASNPAGPATPTAAQAQPVAEVEHPSPTPHAVAVDATQQGNINTPPVVAETEVITSNTPHVTTKGSVAPASLPEAVVNQPQATPKTPDTVGSEAAGHAVPRTLPAGPVAPSGEMRQTDDTVGNAAEGITVAVALPEAVVASPEDEKKAGDAVDEEIAGGTVSGMLPTASVAPPTGVQGTHDAWRHDAEGMVVSGTLPTAVVEPPEYENKAGAAVDTGTEGVAGSGTLTTAAVALPGGVHKTDDALSHGAEEVAVSEALPEAVIEPQEGTTQEGDAEVSIAEPQAVPSAQPAQGVEQPTAITTETTALAEETEVSAIESQAVPSVQPAQDIKQHTTGTTETTAPAEETEVSVVESQVVPAAPPAQSVEQPTAVTTQITAPAEDPGVLLETIFDTPEEAADNRFAIMTHLFSLWGIPAEKLNRRPTCEQALHVGMYCANIAGNWNTLRQLDVPTIIKFAYRNKGFRYALVTALGKKKVTLRFTHREETVSLDEAGRYWFGKMNVLWRLTPKKRRYLRVGMRGADIVWLRRHMTRIDKKSSESTDPALFDAGLSRRLRQFQEKLFLDPDGAAGFRTLVAMDLAAKDPNRPTPRLRRIVRAEHP